MKKLISYALVLMLLVGTIVPAGVASGAKAASDDVSILFTHDMHSHLEDEAKIKTVFNQTNEKYKGTFLLDAGDFSMGTAFQSIYKTAASELRTMAAIGYDVTTFGNHEFDFKAAGLADMLNTAKANENEPLPAIVGTNINWEATLSDEGTKKDGKKLKDAFDNYGVEDYTIIEKNGVKMAIFGVMGDEAVSNSPEAGVEFSDYIKKAEKIVNEIEKNGEADIIVALSHAGLNEDNMDESEDVRLAKEVKGIDVIISGHSHTELTKPEKVGDTLIVSCGEYADNVGHLVLEKSGDDFELKKYELIKLDDSVADDKDVVALVNTFKRQVNSEFFSEYGYSYDQVLAESDFSFGDIKEFGVEQGEEPLGNLIADSFVYAVKENGGGDVDVALVPHGTIRASFGAGDITVSDVYNVSGLGIGDDGSIGYPLVSAYLTGKELRTMAEVDASISPGMSVARLYMSGLGYTINDHRLFLNRATDVMLIDENGNEIKDIDNDKLYRVVAGLYTCQMLSLVKEQSFGLMSIEPKDKDGNVITNFNDFIIKKSDGTELKEWDALASYIDSFDENKVPEYYKETHNKKIVDNSFNPIKILKQPNNIAIMLVAIILIPIVIIAGIVIAVVKRKHERRGYSKSIFSSSRNRGYKRTVGSKGVGAKVRHRRMNVRGKGRSRFR